MDYNLEREILKFCQKNISDRREEFYQYILESSKRVCMEKNIQLKETVNHIVDALQNNFTCIKAVKDINYIELFQDIDQSQNDYLQRNMYKVIKDYDIDILDKNEIEKIVDDPYSYEPSLYIVFFSKNEIVAIDHTTREAFMESFDSVDEAIAYLKIYEESYNFEASLIEKSSNVMLQEMLDSAGYTFGKDEVLRRNYIDSIYEQAKEFNIPDIDYNCLNSMTIDELKDISFKFDEVRKNVCSIYQAIEKKVPDRMIDENSKQKEKLEKSADIQYEKNVI